MWDDFLVEGRPGGQQEMTLGELLQYIKVKPYSSQEGITHIIHTKCHSIHITCLFSFLKRVHYPPLHTMPIV